MFSRGLRVLRFSNINNFLIAVCSRSVAMSTEEPVLELKQGKLRGRGLQNINSVKYFEFKGIPYAKPPIGDLRFKAPQLPEPWDGIRDATKEPNVCIQPESSTNSIVGEEDCLLLNVYTPKLPTPGTPSLPVMVFIHGGGFIHGNGTETARHGPDFLVEQDVVVVSINYRLGIFGFLCLDLPDAQGNMGLKDQVQALRWVNQNISEFGGDPDNVTIFGVSAGGASVEYLQLSPTAKGLFNKAIIQSGSALNPWARNTSSNIKQLAFRIAKLRGKSFSDETELLKYLKSIPSKELVEASVKVITADKHLGGLHFGFVPTVEKNIDGAQAFLTEEPYVLLKKGDFCKVPLISGFCRREGLLILAIGQHIVDKIVKEKKLAEYLPFALDDQQRAELERRLKLHYMDGASGEEEDEYIIDFFTDVDFLGGVWVATKLKALTGTPTYLYEFAYDGKLNYLKKKLGLDRQGACHGDEGGYLMKSDILPTEVPEQDKLVRNRMVAMWTNFAKVSEPTPEAEESELQPTIWHPMSDTEWLFLEIDEDLIMQDSLYPQRLKFFEHLYEKHWP